METGNTSKFIQTLKSPFPIIRFRIEVNQPWQTLVSTQHVNSNKNVNIKFSAHDGFLEYTSSGTLKIERLESLII